MNVPSIGTSAVRGKNQSGKKDNSNKLVNLRQRINPQQAQELIEKFNFKLKKGFHNETLLMHIEHFLVKIDTPIKFINKVKVSF